MELKNNNILAFGTALAFVLSQGGAVYGSTEYSKVGLTALPDVKSWQVPKA